MDLFGILSILFLVASVAAIYVRPEMVLGVQLFATPIFGLALSTLGLGIGVVNTIFSLAVFSLLLHAKRNKEFKFLPSTYIEVAMLGLFLWVAITLTYTPSPIYGTSKLFFLLFISFPCMYVARVYCSNFKNLKIAFTSIGWYAMAIVLFFTLYVALNSVGASRIRSSFFGPLTLGYITVAMIPFIYAVFSSSGFVGRLLSGASLMSAVFVLTATGSRGPAMALVLGCLLALLRIRNFFRAIIGMLIAGWIAYYFASKYAASGLERILGDTEGAYKSTESRYSQFEAAIEQFLQHPFFGQGTGSYSFFFHSLDYRYYPHNSFLEIGGELGLIGLLIYFSILIYCIQRIIKLRALKAPSRSDYQWIIAIIQALFYIGLVNSVLSNDFPSQRILFVSLGMFAATTRWR